MTKHPLDRPLVVRKRVVCKRCEDEGWVCESHPDKAWGSGERCCGGAGMPCRCNKAEPPWHFVPASNLIEKTEVGPK